MPVRLMPDSDDDDDWDTVWSIDGWTSERLRRQRLIWQRQKRHRQRKMIRNKTMLHHTEVGPPLGTLEPLGFPGR